MRFSKPLVLLASIAAFGAEEKTAFKAEPASSYKTTQTNENVTIAAVPFDRDDWNKQAFGKANPNAMGVLPVLIVIQNDAGKTLSVENIRVEYVTRGARIEDTPADELMYAGSGKSPRVKNSPLPGQGGSIKKKKNPLASVEIVSRAFSAKMIPAGESAHGFFYFQTPPRSGARLYLTGVREAKTGKELFYFEIPLD